MPPTPLTALTARSESFDRAFHAARAQEYGAAVADALRRTKGRGTSPTHAELLRALARRAAHHAARSLPALLLVLALGAQAVNAQSPQASRAPKRHVTRPIYSITVKVVAPEDYARAAKGADRAVTRSGKPAQWIVTTLDMDSCVAWVPANAQPNAATAALDAFVACQVVQAQIAK